MARHGKTIGGIVEADTEVLVGLGLFVASELIGMSKLKSNSVLQLVLGSAMRAFPFEVRLKSAETPEPRSTTTRRRSRG